MRTFVLVCVVAIVVAVGVSYAVGFVAVATEHTQDKCVVTLTVDTGMLHRGLGAHETPIRAEGTHDDLTQMQGKIAAVRPEKSEFALSDNLKNWTFQLAKGGKVFIDGQESELTALRPGDEATVNFDRHGQEMVASAVHCTRK